jgi:hypothetical protein
MPTEDAVGRNQMFFFGRRPGGWPAAVPGKTKLIRLSGRILELLNSTLKIQSGSLAWRNLNGGEF